MTCLLKKVNDDDDDDDDKDKYFSNFIFSKKHNIISGFEDNTFRGLNVIAKNQIVAVAARTLRQQMNYKTPSDITKELSVYGDNTSVENWAREDVALATMCNLVMKRTDGNFGGTANMTRGDAAIIIYRLFQKIW